MADVTNASSVYRASYGQGQAPRRGGMYSFEPISLRIAAGVTGLACLILLCARDPSAHAQPVCDDPDFHFCEDFTSGVIDPDRFSVFGGAMMWIEGDQLMVHLADDESGFNVDLSDLGLEPESFLLDYEVVGELPVEDALEVTLRGQSPVEATADFVVAGAVVWRPFWNRCVLALYEDDVFVGCIAIGGATMGDPDAVSCSELLGGDLDDESINQRISFELLGKADGTEEHRPEGHEQIRFTIEGEFHEDVDTDREEDPTCCLPHDGTGCNDPRCVELVCAIDPFCCDVEWDALCAELANDLCEVCLLPTTRTVFRDKRTANTPGCGAPIGSFEKGVTQIESLRVRYLGDIADRPDVVESCFPGNENGDENDQNGDENDPEAPQASGITLAIHRVAVRNTHEPDVAPAAAISPLALDPGDEGDVITVSIVTDDDMVLSPDTTLDMGADVLVHNVTVTGPHSAEAEIEVNPRARNGGRLGRIDTGDDWRYLQFRINPLCPAELPENEPPTVALNAPYVVDTGQSLTIDTQWDDPDDVWIRSVVVVFDEETDEEFFSTDFFKVFPTHPDPVEMSFSVPGLPSGYYQIYAVADDGIAWDIQYRPLYVIDPIPCPGDITGPEGEPDGVVDVFDLLMVISEWGPCDDPDDCPADVTGPDGEPDEIVDVFDLLAIISEWGSCP